MMTDPAGNVLPTSYEKSIIGQAYTAADNLDKALLKLAHACAVRRTKKEIREDIKEAEELILSARKRIRG